jgi:dTDP-4-dehydrorhamnose reductase
MIKGRGLLAKALKIIDGNEYVFYANGISNSVLQEIPFDNFEIKELKTIANDYPDKLLIYFSTCQVNSERNYSRPYVKHKLLIEEFISKNFPHYLIVRTSNLVGFNPWNSHTLFNYLNHALLVNKEISVNPSLIRNFLDVDHFVSLLSEYIKYNEKNKIVEIVNPVSYSMQEIIDDFEKYFSKKFILQVSNDRSGFAFFDLNPQLSLKLMEKSSVCFDDHITTLLKKYYAADSLKRPLSTIHH